MDPLTLLAIAWLFSDSEAEKKRKAVRAIRDIESRIPAARPAARRPAARPAARRPAARPAARPAVRPAARPATPERPIVDILPAKITPTAPNKLVSRANQQRARDWIPALVKSGMPADRAKMVARWIGLESSGNPLAMSPIGERGLLQATKTTALQEKLFTPAEWDQLQSPATTRDRHAQLARKQFAFHVVRSKRWVQNPPADDAPDWAWYAKMHHTRPLDLKVWKVHGPALAMARDLQTRLANDAQAMHRLRVANVVAFGKSEA